VSCSRVLLLAFMRGMALGGFFCRPKRDYYVRASHRRSLQMLASRSLPFDPQAAAVGIRGTAGAIGIPGAEGIVDRVRGERRAETGLSRLSGLFGLSC
jgi:hypothetical protein